MYRFFLATTVAMGLAATAILGAWQEKEHGAGD
jgi:hypothetical protein